MGAGASVSLALIIGCGMGRKPDLRRVDAVVREFQSLRDDPELADRFRDYIHECKESGAFGSGERGDYTMAELRGLAREFLDHLGLSE
jgi:hypothetical protein